MAAPRAKRKIDPFPAPPISNEVRLQFGHNASIGQVIMVFGVSCDHLTFTPEQADIAADQLRQHAEAVRKAIH